MNSWLARNVRFGAVAVAAAVLVGCVDTTSYQYLARDKGIKHFKAGDYATAAGSFQDALRHEPRDYKSMYYMAASHDAMNMHQQAISEYKTALSVLQLTEGGSKDAAFRAQILDSLAQSLAKGEDSDVQIAQIRQEAQAKNSAEQYYLLAKIYQYSGDADNALAAFAQASTVDRENARYTKDYGLYLERLGQTARAEQVLQRAAAIDPNDAEVTAALRRLGSVPSAASAQPVQRSAPRPAQQRPAQQLRTNAAPAAPAPQD